MQKFNSCDIIGANESRLQAFPALVASRLEPVRRLVAMSKVYHAIQLTLFNPSIEHITPDCTCQGKKCTKCKQVRCVGHFHRHVRSRDKLRAECKLCRKAEYETDDFKVNRRSHYRENADHINELKRAVYAHDPEKHCRRSKVYRENNPEKVATYTKEYNQAHWQMRDTNRKMREELAGGHYTAQQWRNLKVYYNYTCLRCGKQEPDIKLAPDHVIPIVNLGTSDISNIQPLCIKCNQIKATQVIDYRLTWKGEASG